MKAMVTGGAGFIGSNLVKALLKDGWNVISIDDYSAGKKENLASVDSKNFYEVNCDVTERDKNGNLIIEKYFKDIDVVFNQGASKKNICLKNPHRDLEVNGDGTLGLLELARKYNIKKFIHASTGSVYGEAVVIPQDENHPLKPVSYYGVSKLAGESYVKLFNHLYGLDTTVLRYFHVYGPYQDYGEFGGVVSIFVNNIINNQILNVYGDGNQQRSFTFVEDVVKANIGCVLNEKTKGQVYNCVSGIKVTINELIQYLADITKIKPKVEYKDWLIGDIKKFDVSNEKIKRDLNIEFLTDFSCGLKEVIDWMKNSD